MSVSPLWYIDHAPDGTRLAKWSHMYSLSKSVVSNVLRAVVGNYKTVECYSCPWDSTNEIKAAAGVGSVVVIALPPAFEICLRAITPRCPLNMLDRCLLAIGLPRFLTCGEVTLRIVVVPPLLLQQAWVFPSV